MYLKVRVTLDEQRPPYVNGTNWRIFGGIKHLRYSYRNNWSWDEYQKWCSNVDYSTGPINKDEWYKNVASDGKRMYAYAQINFEDGSNMLVMWHLVAYLLNEEGKTIEVIDAVG